MVELARGSVGDRPWGRTLAALGLRAVTGQLTLLSDGKHFLVAFEHGAVVAAVSPLASDAAVRVALTSHLISSSQVPEISRRQAQAPDRDEIDVIAELARLGPDHALRLRRRVIAQRAARTFSINHGDFLVTDETELQVLRGCELDIRAIIYMGARANLPEHRLAAELDQLGGWFRLKAADDDLPQFGFTDVEQPVVERLRDGGTLAELEDFATSFVDARTVRAVVYALAAYNACEVGPAPAGAQVRRAEASSPGLAATQPMPRITAPGAPLAHSVPRPFTQPIPRTVTPPGSAPLSPAGARTVTPGTTRTVTPPAERATRAAARATQGAQQTEPMTTFSASEGAELVGRAATVAHQTEPLTVFPDGAPVGEPRRHRRSTAPPPAESRFDPPTQRDAGPEPTAPEAPRPRRLSELAAPRDGVSPGLSRPIEPTRDRVPTPPARPAPNAVESRTRTPAGRDRSSPGLARPLDDRPREALRFATDDIGAGSSPGLRYPSDDPSTRDGSSPPLRHAEPVRGGSSPRLPRPELRDSARTLDPWDPASTEPTHGDDSPDDPLELPLMLETPTHRDISALGYTLEDDPSDPATEPSAASTRNAPPADAAQLRSASAAAAAIRSAAPADAAHQHSAAPADAGYQHTAAPTDAGYQRSAAPADAGYQHRAAPADAGYQRSASPADAGYQRSASPADAGYQRSASPADAGHQRSAAPADAGYQRSAAPADAGYQRSAAPADAGHQRSAAPADAGYQRSAAPADAGYQRSASPADAGYQRSASPADAGYQRSASPADAGYQRSASPADAGYQRSASPADAGYQRSASPADAGPARSGSTDAAHVRSASPADTAHARSAPVDTAHARSAPADDAHARSASADAAYARSASPADATHARSAASAPAAADATAGLLIRRVTTTRAPAVRQVATTDSPQSHTVKALIAQRLKLLDSGADHFQLLGVAQDASADSLRKAYFALARQLHPDRLAALGISDDGKHAQRLFAQINAGFALLSDGARRDHYLSVLRRGGEAAIRAEQARADELATRILDAEEAFHRGEVALRRDQPQAAVVELERAIQLNPDEADYHALLAWARFCTAPDKMSVASATRSALDQAIQRSPRSVTARFFLGRVERMLGRDQDALRHFREVLDQAPGHTEAAAEIRVLESRQPPGRKR